MEQRPLRLGDIVDDYCTRERRVTNHAIVAIVGDAIRQTRCTTCDSEHPYKGAKEPRLRKKSAGTELYDQVLSNVNGTHVPAMAQTDSPDELSVSVEAAAGAENEPVEPAPASDDPPPPAEDPGHEVWPGHRRLIRATLPRSENEPAPPRPIPEFTMHQRPPARAGRGFRFRGPSNGHGNPNGNPNGNVNGNVNGNRQEFGHGRSRSRRHRGKKRPR